MLETIGKRALDRRAADLAIVALIVLAGLKLTYGLERIVDIGLYDESGYLYGGVSLASKGLFPASWAPLYAAWYFLLSWFEPDRVRLYYLNYKILTIAPAVLIYIAMRAYRVGLAWSAGAAWLFLISLANLYVWPKPAHFALMIILLFFTLVRSSGRLVDALPVLAIGALVSSFVRPEYILSYVLLSLAYVVLAIRQRGENGLRTQLIPALTLVAASVGLMAVFGVPGLDNQGSRSWEAFSQHFSINWVSWTGSTLNPWTDYQQIMAANFGGAHSIMAALRYSPGLVLRHVVSNIGNYLLALIQMPFVHFNVLLPGASKAASQAEGGLLVLALGAYAAARRRELFAGLRSRARGQLPLLLAAAVFALPATISAIVIYPESHYLLAELVLAALVAGALLAPAGAVPSGPSAARLLALAAVLLVATPYLSANWYFSEQSAPVERQLNNLHTIEYLRGLRLAGDVRMLEADGGYYIYVGDNIKRVAQSTKDTDFGTFLRYSQVDLIVVSSDLAGDSRFRDDPAWLAFLRDSRAFGYETVDIPGTDRKLIARGDLLAVRR